MKGYTQSIVSTSEIDLNLNVSKINTRYLIGEIELSQILPSHDRYYNKTKKVIKN